MKVLFDAFQAVSGGELPEKMESVSDCLVHMVGALMKKWIQGDPDVAPVVDALLQAAQNPKDPLMKDLGFAQRTAFLQGVGALLNIQEDVRAQREEAAKQREEEERRLVVQRAGDQTPPGA